MKNNLDRLIHLQRFDEAKKIVDSSDFDWFSEEIMYNAYEHSTVIYYDFLKYLISQNESLCLHDLAFSILVNPLCHLEGAYSNALRHARRCIELTGQNDVDYLAHLLFLYDVPDRIVSDEEATDIAKKILSLDPNNELAKEFLKKK